MTIEQVPIEQHDPKDLLDAEAIRVLTERTAQEALRTSETSLGAELELARREREVAEHVARHQREANAMMERHERDVAALHEKLDAQLKKGG
ncbi:MAG: hypothetical protein IPM79_09565 [Polyangiaceae bacterium]|nr:hypothetical protein [Polyangiaceae bacterium]